MMRVASRMLSAGILLLAAVAFSPQIAIITNHVLESAVARAVILPIMLLTLVVLAVTSTDLIRNSFMLTSRHDRAGHDPSHRRTGADSAMLTKILAMLMRARSLVESMTEANRRRHLMTALPHPS